MARKRTLASFVAQTKMKRLKPLKVKMPKYKAVKPYRFKVPKFKV